MDSEFGFDYDNIRLRMSSMSQTTEDDDAVFKSTATYMGCCFIIALILMVIYIVGLAYVPKEIAIVQNKCPDIIDFVDWRIYLYKAELVLCSMIILGSISKWHKYEILFCGYVCYFILWVAGIINIVWGMVIFYDKPFQEM